MANLGFNLVADNDVITKCSCYGTLSELGAIFNGTIGILGSAKFVVEGLLNRDHRIRDSKSALNEFMAFLLTASEIEPSDGELKIATLIEELAIAQNLELDSGESQLCAVLMERGVTNLVTGDKRAIRALEVLRSHESILDSLVGRVICFEQLMLAIGLKIGIDRCRAQVCAEPEIDRALTACFSCHTMLSGGKADQSGLISYINFLRKEAATILHPHDWKFD